MQIIVFLLGLSLLITIHELGHFIVAKLFGVYCHEFSIGMGPAIFSKKKGETKYSLRWLPIGGYVSMAGEEVNSDIKEPQKDDAPIETELLDDNKDDKEEVNYDYSSNQVEEVVEVIENKEKEEDKPDIPYERTINGIKAWKRFLVIGAGVFMNFILAYILFFISVIDIGMPDEAPYLNVDYTSSESEVYAFQEAGIKEGRFKVEEVQNRIVYSYNGNEVEICNDKYGDFESYENPFNEVSKALGVPAKIGEQISKFNSDVNIVTKDDVQTITFESKDYIIKQYLIITSEGEQYYPSREINKLVFQNDLTKENSYTISGFTPNNLLGYTQCSRNATLGECFVEAGKMEVQNGLAIFDALGKLFTKEGINNVGGIIAMADASNTYLDYGFGYYMAFLGLISVNLGVMNLLPIPGLDGSQLLVIIVEGITRKKLPNNAKAIINFIGLIFLMGLMILITVKDVFKFLV